MNLNKIELEKIRTSIQTVLDEHNISSNTDMFVGYLSNEIVIKLERYCYGRNRSVEVEFIHNKPKNFYNYCKLYLSRYKMLNRLEVEYKSLVLKKIVDFSIIFPEYNDYIAENKIEINFLKN